MRLTADAFTIVNTKAESSQEKDTSVFYKTDDATWNVMRLTFTNKTGVDLQFKGGTPVITEKSDAASSFYFDFSTLLPNTVVSQIEVKDKDGLWTAKYYAPNGVEPGIIAIAPINDLTIPKNGSVVFSMEKITCETLLPGNFDLSYVNIKDVTSRAFPFTYHLSVLNPPVGDPLPVIHSYADVTHFIGDGPSRQNFVIDPGKVVAQELLPFDLDINYNNSYPVKNGVTLYLQNDSDISWGKKDTPSTDAVIYVSFVFGDDNESITTPDLGKAIRAGIRFPATSPWELKHDEGSPNWQLVPRSNEILKGREILYIDLSSIITALNAEPKYVTSIYVQTNNIGNYRDMVLTYHATKRVAKASIEDFIVRPKDKIPAGQNVSMDWKSNVAWKVELVYNRRNLPDVTLSSENGQIRLNEEKFNPPDKPTANTTKYKLYVYDKREDPAAFSESTLTVEYPAAEIQEFSADRYLAPVASGQNTIKLTWKVLNAETVFLNGVDYTGKTGAELSLLETTTYKLVANSFQYPPTSVEKSFTVFGYQASNPIDVGIAGQGDAFQSLPIIYANADRGRIYASNQASGTITQASAGTKQPVTPTYLGPIMALNASGSRLFITKVVRDAPSTLLVYDTMSAGSQPLFSTALNSPPPYSMAVSSDNRWLLLLWQNGLNKVSLYSISGDQNSVSYIQDIGVGISPEAYWFKDASTIYIGNFKEKTISVIDLPAKSVKATITLNTGQPCAFAQVDNFLYVACSAGDTLGVIDLNDNSVKPEIQVGGRPFSITVGTDPNGQPLLFVTNFGQNTVSVVDPRAKKEITKITVGLSPSAAQLGKKGRLLFVSNYCDKTLSVVDISTSAYKVVGSIDLGQNNGNPLDMATFPSAEQEYTNVFIAKENFLARNQNCNKKMTDANLNMSVFSIQERTPPKLSNEIKLKPVAQVVPHDKLNKKPDQKKK